MHSDLNSCIILSIWSHSVWSDGSLLLSSQVILFKLVLDKHVLYIGIFTFLLLTSLMMFFHTAVWSLG